MNKTQDMEDIETILENSDKWLEWYPKTKLGELFFDFAETNLPRHMPVVDWNKPWAVCLTKVFESLLNLQLQQIKKMIEGKRDIKYPQNRFIDSETGETSPGVQEETEVRMVNQDDLDKMAIYDDILKELEEM